MSQDTTPANWPLVEEEGLLPALWAALFGRADHGPGELEAPLTKGACLRLERPGRLSLRCLEGKAWATGDFGRDLVLTTGVEVDIRTAQGVIITALSPAARLLMRWR